MLLEPPSVEQQTINRKFFNEDLNTRTQDLDNIKDWLRKQPHLPDSWDEHGLYSFLRASFFSVEQCKKRLDMYFTLRAAIPEFFTNRDILNPDLQRILRDVDGAVLPKVTPNADRVSIARAANPNIETPNFAELCKLVFMIGDLRIICERAAVGDVYILDAGIPLSKHFMNVSLFTIRKFLVTVQEAYPAFIKEIHIINATNFVDYLINAIKPFLGEKLRAAIHVHTKLDTLYDFVPRDILPEDYGGNAGKLLDLKARWVKALEEYRTWFKEQECVKTDETKRPGKITTVDELFGFDGNFKQLSID